MLTSSQRAFLKSLAQKLDPIVMVGKGGITETVVAEANDKLRVHELIKGKVLETAPETAREALEELARLCHAEPVQSIGSKFVLYRPNPDLPAEKRIHLKK
ncbi:MAG: ribosome assembly RNA-binding protein YhbY [bacterium]